jgi:hypothetical protein
MRKLALALATSSLLAAPLAMANCDSELDRIESRLEQSGTSPQQKQRLRDWIGDQRVLYRDATTSECAEVAAEIDRQMSGHGYFSAAAPGAPARVDLDGADVAVTAPPSDVRIEQPTAQVDVTQPAPQVSVQMQSPRIVIHVPEPDVQVNQQQPEVSVSHAEPQVSVTQDEPEIRVQQADPVVSVQHADPQVEVRRAETGVDGQPLTSVVTVDPSEPLAADVPPSSDRMSTTDAPRFTADTGPTTQLDDSPVVDATRLNGVTVVNIEGHVLGVVSEVLQERDSERVVVRVQANQSIGLGTPDLLLHADELERNAGNLLTRNALGELQQANRIAEERLAPVAGVQVELAASDED